MAMARGTAAMSSFRITTCADSEAAVDVPSVMAMPISAAANTGASFTPSPTIIVTPRDGVTVAVVTAVTLSSGNSSACTSSMPTSLAMMAAEDRLSPVSMDSLATPRPRRLASADLALARGTSRRTIRAMR